MQIAVEKSPFCAACGMTGGLTAHYPPGGRHSANWHDYVVLCWHDHGKLDGGRRLSLSPS